MRALLIALAALLLAAAPAAAQTGSGAATKAPSVRAPSAILVEPATGDVVFQRGAQKARPIASTTKLMTALLTLERADLDDVVTTVPYSAAPAESVIGLRAGERMTIRDLLRALLLASANDAAATLATRVAGSRPAFVRLMNRRAKQLGLKQTQFANPIGLDDPSNHGSAADLVKLALILRKNEFFRETTDRPRATLRSGSRPRTIVNRNLLVRDVGFVNGVKTGHTSSAGYILVGSATRDGVTVISAVLGDPSEAARDQDTLALLRYGLRSYRVSRAVGKGQVMQRAGLKYRDGDVALVSAGAVRRTVRRGEKLSVRLVDAPDEIEGPLPKGARVGTIAVRQRGRTVANVALVTGAAVPEASLTQRLGHFLSSTSSIVLIVALLVCSLQLVLLRRRAVRRRQRPAGGTEVA
jgi:D-alanyl-D-alanine carboxypeptidase (penicillin-binding protein 5/6)